MLSTGTTSSDLRIALASLTCVLSKTRQSLSTTRYRRRRRKGEGERSWRTRRKVTEEEEKKARKSVRGEEGQYLSERCLTLSLSPRNLKRCSVPFASSPPRIVSLRSRRSSQTARTTAKRCDTKAQFLTRRTSSSSTDTIGLRRER